MEDILKFTTKFTPKHYLNLTISNSAFDDIQEAHAEVVFTLMPEVMDNGLSIRFGSLESVKLNYEGYFEEQDTWNPTEDNFDDFSNWKITTYFDHTTEKDKTLEFLLKEIYVDVIKKKIDLYF